MLFLRRVLLALLAFVGFTCGILLGVYNAQAVSFSLLVFTLPAMPIGLLVIAALALGVCIGYAGARVARIFSFTKKHTKRDNK